ncbi:hypothetical protein ILYODFUR_037972, partial [Ilyodon furcidens]
PSVLHLLYRPTSVRNKCFLQPESQISIQIVDKQKMFWNKELVHHHLCKRELHIIVI